MADNMTRSEYANRRAKGKQMAFDLYDVIKLNEGYKPAAYKDTKGNMTIGVGFNLESPSNRKYLEEKHGLTYDDVVNKGVQLNDKQIRDLYVFSARNAYEDAKVFDPKIDSRPHNVRVALIDLAFNLGRLKLVGGTDAQGNKVKGFVNMRKALQNDDYQTASAEMKDSNWFNQVKTRGPRMVGVMANADNLTQLLNDIRN
jgi:GH24 family phage-related lysozyme (muramidase)